MFAVGRQVAHRQVSYWDLVILVLSIFTLLILALDTFLNLNTEVIFLLYSADTLICIIFLTDFFVRLFRADAKWSFFKKNWIDVVSSVPLVPGLRVGRIVRVLRILRLIRGFRSSHRVMTMVLAHRQATSMSAVLTVTFIVIILSSALLLEFENPEHSNIGSAGDALWWAIATVTTVGYGDTYPATTAGRLVALFPMLCGVGVTALLTSVLAAWYLKPQDAEQAVELAEIVARLDRIEEYLCRLSDQAVRQ